MRPVTLARPRIARDLVTRTVAGTRPFRPAGFRVELEDVAGRTILHHYGHGGSGLTLAPGTAAMAARLATTTPHRTAAVIGGGAVGLMTARALQHAGIAVTVYAAAVSPDTTSNVAGALWGAFSLVDPEHRTAAIGRRIARAARRAHRDLTRMPPDRYGIRRVPLYLVGKSPVLPWELGLTPELFRGRLLGREEHPFRDDALRTASLMIEPQRFLDAVLADVREAGGSLVLRRFASLDDVLALTEPLLVNCAGAGAARLFGDGTLVPIKGELALLGHQPAIDYAVVSLDDDAYVLPREGALAVGGSRVRGDWSTVAGEDATDGILARARALFR